MSTADTITDPVKVLRELDADAIAARLEELDAEARALRVLLRSARARQSAQRRRAKEQGGADGRP
jgi:hypothetical protein